MKKKIIIIGIIVILLVVGLSGCNEQTEDNSEDGNGGVTPVATQPIQVLSYDVEDYKIVSYDWSKLALNVGSGLRSDGTKSFVVPADFDISDINDYGKRRAICLEYIEPTISEEHWWYSDYWGYNWRSWTSDNTMDLSNFRLSDDIYEWVVSGTAKNTGNEFLSRPKITVNFYNSANAWLAKETDTASNIASGYTWNFEVTYSGKYKNDVSHIDFEFDY